MQEKEIMYICLHLSTNCVCDCERPLHAQKKLRLKSSIVSNSYHVMSKVAACQTNSGMDVVVHFLVQYLDK